MLWLERVGVRNIEGVCRGAITTITIRRYLETGDSISQLARSWTSQFLEKWRFKKIEH
jgi:hypothetical protein